MRHTTWIMAAVLFSVAACGGVTSPYGGGGGGSAGGGGGPVGQVTVGNNFFRSAHNGSQNPAVDTIAAGSGITWRWNAAGTHSVRSTGAPSFTNSGVLSAANASYSLTFNTPGTYSYDCSVHGSAMTGRVVVQ